MKANKISIILWIVNLAAIAASVFSYVYLAYFVYLNTQTVLYSDLVLLMPMLVPVIFCFAINNFSKTLPPYKLLTLANIAGAIIAVITYKMIPSLPLFALLGGLSIGFLDATQRVARLVAIKKYFSAEDVKYAVPITLTAQFIAGGIAGVIMTFWKGAITPNMALIVVVSLFVMATFAALLLPRDVHETTAEGANKISALGTLKSLSQLLKTQPQLKQQFYTFVLFVSVFQGFFNVSRVSLPTFVLHLSDTYVGILQIISATSALIGAILFYVLNKKGFIFKISMTRLLSVISLVAMMGSTVLTNILPSYALYFVYMFLFELLFFKYQADVVSVCPKEEMPMVATFQYAAVYIGMMIIIFIGGLVTQIFGLTWAAALCVGLYLIIMLIEAIQVQKENQIVNVVQNS